MEDPESGSGQVPTVSDMPTHLTAPAVDLTALAHRLDLIAHELTMAGRMARFSYAQVLWTGEARQAVDDRLDLQEAQLALLVAEIRERAQELRRVVADGARP